MLRVLVAAAVGLLMSILSSSNSAVACAGLLLANRAQVHRCRFHGRVSLSPLCTSPEMEAKYNKKMQALRDELDLRRKTEIHEVEERKNNQISELMKNHEKAFHDFKNYHDDVTFQNLALISLLKVLPACSLTPLLQPCCVVSPGNWCSNLPQIWPVPWWKYWHYCFPGSCTPLHEQSSCALG